VAKRRGMAQPERWHKGERLGTGERGVSRVMCEQRRG